MNCRSVSVRAWSAVRVCMTHTEQAWTGRMNKTNTTAELCLVIVESKRVKTTSCVEPWKLLHKYCPHDRSKSTLIQINAKELD
ncbi:hypothetical protein J6590_024055 [Homalodisca vitripennis]|nr:hypothetical protein J6590_024055 [Homalodisca vitripennis]